MITKSQGTIHIGSMTLDAEIEIEWEPDTNAGIEHLRNNKTITVEGTITPIVDEAHQLPERLN